MTDFSLRVLAHETDRALADIDKRVNRATMWGVRAAARRVKTVAKKRIPVYKGGDPRAEKGLLKKSVHSDKRLTSHGDGEYSVKVGPRGDRVRLYRGKIEQDRHYMAQAYESVVPELGRIYHAAWEKAMRR